MSTLKLKSCSPAELAYARHNLLKLASHAPVPFPHAFVAPLKLHRRDLSSLAPGPDPSLPLSPPSPPADLTAIAPFGGALRAKQNAFKKKTRQVTHVDPEERKLRQEERLPWVLEDFDGSNTWAGSLEGAHTDCYVLFVAQGSDLRVVPVNRSYKFKHRPRASRGSATSLEEAEETLKKMKERKEGARWYQKIRDQEAAIASQSTSAKQEHSRLRTIPRSNPHTRHREAGDVDELDFTQDFADDEETPIYEGNEEENKELEEKIKREMLSANALGDPPKDDDLDELFQDTKMTKEGRKLQKSLRALEKNLAYDSDDERNPYASEDEESSSDRESDKKSDISTKDDKPHPATKTNVSPNISPSDYSLSAKPLSHRYPRSSSRISKVVIFKLPPSKLEEFAQSFAGMAVYQSPPHSRAASPTPQKRPHGHVETSDMSDGGENKKIKIKLSTPPLPSVAPPVSSQNLHPNDAWLITKDELAAAISEKRLNTKDLLAMFKPKLRSDPRNKARISVLLKEVAILEGGFLIPRRL
ncbi:Transcription initiation factor IIF subunit alpha [Neolecta irregularis DAH-3]|uniref:Transcription initiation factor IIF subunit alpha n=1 Tax=Neolecta irregularis (strain DAH-3) TaxID=1198029 RepID=A0A1U7LTZ3_NEOID|nr:Transcription initiation factor IIF subunit alpha [Neolecta irregularis DAH-3]|eukprot:OLL26114.1 Transcription initiation factor IIF subunit alpha [Neolecta irregularis DAH-3]